MKHTFTKWLTGVLCLCLLWGKAVQAEEPTVFHVENQSGKAGDVVSVPVTMESGEEVGGFDITVYYDGDTLEFCSLKWGELTEDGGISDYNHKEENHSVKIIYVTADTVQANGTVAVLEFMLKKDCTEELPIGIGDREVIGNEEDSPFVPSSVTGVDETFQSGLEENVSETNTAGSNVSDSGDSQIRTSETGQGEENIEQTGDVAASSGQGKSEEENQETNGKNNVAVSLAAGIGCALVMILAVLWILKGRKRNKK